MICGKEETLGNGECHRYHSLDAFISRFCLLTEVNDLTPVYVLWLAVGFIQVSLHNDPVNRSTFHFTNVEIADSQRECDLPKVSSASKLV